jgi:SP family arabinose:H+ symporter-like MFS transporter
MGFVAGHAFRNGVACWVIISEIYPAKVRGRAMSIATTALWLVGYLGNQLFPSMMKHLKASGTFWVIASGAVLTIFFVYFETRGQTLEQITPFWRSRRDARYGTSTIDITPERLTVIRCFLSIYKAK